jgi:hypothetical protein
MKIRPVWTELFHAERRASGHMTKLMIIFRSFTNASKNLFYSHYKSGSIGCGFLAYDEKGKNPFSHV